MKLGPQDKISANVGRWQTTTLKCPPRVKLWDSDYLSFLDFGFPDGGICIISSWESYRLTQKSLTDYSKPDFNSGSPPVPTCASFPLLFLG